jgi:hypothetical protein
MISILKAAQLALSLGAIVLVWVVFPGLMVIIATAIGIIYVAAAIGAILDYRMAIWAAFVFSIITAAYSIYGVIQFSRNGFDFLTGNFDQHGGFYFYPYMFLAISLGAGFVVIANLVSWHWMVSGWPRR